MSMTENVHRCLLEDILCNTPKVVGCYPHVFKYVSDVQRWPLYLAHECRI